MSAVASWLSSWVATEYSKRLHTIAWVSPWSLVVSSNFFIRLTKGKTSLVSWKNISSSSVVLSTIYVCIWLAHIIVQLTYIIKYPILDRNKPGPLPSYWFHPPAKLASTYNLILFSGYGFGISPCISVPFRYFRTGLNAWLWGSLVPALNRAHQWTANCATGRVEFVRYLSDPFSDL